MSDIPPEPMPPHVAAPSAGVLQAWLAQSHDLLALTDDAGRIQWANSAFSAASGLAIDQNLFALAPADWLEGAPAQALADAAATGHADHDALCLRGPTGEPLWVCLRSARVADQLLWTLQDISASRAHEARATHLSELLDMAQEFGRLGVWERDIRTGKGRWDRHVFNFFGLPPSEGTPPYEISSQLMHPDDLAKNLFPASLHKAGRYSWRYRVVHPNGGLRWIHSQWEVKNSARGEPERTIGIMVDDTEAYELARSLNATNAHLALAAELGNIVIWRHDFKTDRVLYNDQGCAILGLPQQPDGLPVEAIRDLIHPDDVGEVVASGVRSLSTHQPDDVTARYRRSDGVWRTMLGRRVVERDAAGVAIAFVGVSLDVTQQADQARHAQRLARRLEAAAQAGRMGLWSAVVDSDETEWNPQMFALFDWADSDRPPRLHEWLQRCVHPDDLTHVEQTVRSHASVGQGAFEVEFRILTRTGRTRWIVLRADLDQVLDQPLRLSGIAIDVTAQHEVLTALHTASERSSLIAHHAGIGTWQTDAAGQNALWDEQMFRLRGLPPGKVALAREERLALVHPDDRAHVLDADPSLNADVPASAYEFRVRWPDGSIHWLASRSAPLRDQQGEFVARLGVNWDVTESKNAELARQQVQLAERESLAKSDFLSRMSHELRTPLNAVLGFTQLLQADAREADAEERLGKLNHVRAAGEHLLALINDALELSGLESGQAKPDLQAVPLKHAVGRALALLDALASAGQVRLRTLVLAETVLVDPTRLHQVLLNLFSNVIKNNRPPTEVVLSSETVGALVLLRISDSERELSTGQLAQLFEPFNRLGVEGEGLEGSGIGLTIARAMVESMGGDIAVTSTAREGTVFDLRLPSAAVNVPIPVWSALAPIANALPLHSPQRGCLLYIEDNEVNVLLVEELVKSIEGLHFEAEPTGALGVAAAARLRPDLILVDLQLPDFDGFEVLRRLRAQSETADTPCIALSANALPEDIERGRAAGFDDYWTKPIRFKPFLDALSRLFPLDTAAVDASR